MKPATKNEIDAAKQAYAEGFTRTDYTADEMVMVRENAFEAGVEWHSAARQEQPAGEVDLRDCIEAGLSVQNAEAKLWALLTGLECRNVDDFMARADTESYLRFGNAYITRAKELIAKPAADPVRGEGDVCETVTITAHDNAMYDRLVEILLVEMPKYPDGLDADDLLKAIIADRDANPAPKDAVGNCK